MKIDPFIIHVTPEQSKTIQNIMFKNGYRWAGGENKDPLYLDNKTGGFYDYIILEDDFRLSLLLSVSNPIELVLRCSREEDETLTFDEFLNLYSLKYTRRKKLKKLQIFQK